jgi:hypothetical protein
MHARTHAGEFDVLGVSRAKLLSTLDELIELYTLDPDGSDDEEVPTDEERGFAEVAVALRTVVRAAAGGEGGSGGNGGNGGRQRGVEVEVGVEKKEFVDNWNEYESLPEGESEQ